MRRDASVKELRAVIERLPPDAARERPGKWYRTEHEHWLGWLGEYAGPGAYGRKTASPTEARRAYNRIVEPGMLLYLTRAAGVDAVVVADAERQAASASSLMQGSGRVRRLIPWDVVADLLPDPPRRRWGWKRRGR